MDNNVNIETNVIRITSGTGSETLIKVPLAGIGELDPQATIRLTVGFDSDQSSSSTYLRVGLSDGSNNRNQFIVYGTASSYVAMSSKWPHKLRV